MKTIKFRDKLEAKILDCMLPTYLTAICKMLDVRSVLLTDSVVDINIENTPILKFIKKDGKFYQLNGDGSKTEISEPFIYIELTSSPVDSSSVQQAPVASSSVQQAPVVEENTTPNTTLDEITESVQEPVEETAPEVVEKPVVVVKKKTRKKSTRKNKKS